jgi:quercetin dioxygenase-like cupin family protein
MTGCLASRSSASEERMARTFRFDAELGQHVSQFGSDFVMSRLFHSGDLHVGCMRLAPGGVIGLHPAASAQILAVVEGDGWIRGADESKTPIGVGGAVFWSEGEVHEAGTDTGLVAIVVESPTLIDGPSLGPIPAERRRSRPA